MFHDYLKYKHTSEQTQWVENKMIINYYLDKRSSLRAQA